MFLLWSPEFTFDSIGIIQPIRDCSRHMTTMPFQSCTRAKGYFLSLAIAKSSSSLLFWLPVKLLPLLTKGRDF